MARRISSRARTTRRSGTARRVTRARTSRTTSRVRSARRASPRRGAVRAGGNRTLRIEVVQTAPPLLNGSLGTQRDIPLFMKPNVPKRPPNAQF